MKRIELYKCEVCGTQYNDEEVCHDCELGHMKQDQLLKQIVNVRYLPITQDASGMPITITLLGNDGKHYQYKR